MTQKTPDGQQILPGKVEGFPDTLNLRELGGLQTADGRRVRHGLLFRGSALANLTQGQRARVDELDLRFILDLRALGETVDAADYVPAGAEYLRIGGMYDADGVEVDFSPAGIARLEERFENDGELFMRGLYVNMMFGNPALRELMRRFVACEAPLYFHCTAGKDRTGVCAAVLLMALGVPDNVIIDEYLRTNLYRADIINMPPDQIPPEVTGDLRERWASVNGVSEDDLRASIAAVDERYASRETYFLEEFGVDAKTLGRVADWYLEG